MDFSPPTSQIYTLFHKSMLNWNIISPCIKYLPFSSVAEKEGDSKVKRVALFAFLYHYHFTKDVSTATFIEFMHAVETEFDILSFHLCYSAKISKE